MSAVPSFPGFVTVEEYFRGEEVAEARHDYWDGQVVMNQGGTYRHSVVTANVIGEIRQRLKGKPCATSDANTRVGVQPGRKYVYPDVTVVCGTPEFDSRDKTQVTVTNPTLVVEVLSEGTEVYDRRKKFRAYLAVASLKQYVLVSTDAPEVETYLRRDDGTWVFSFVKGLDKSVMLDAIGVEIPLSEVYERVEFEAASADEG